MYAILLPFSEEHLKKRMSIPRELYENDEATNVLFDAFNVDEIREYGKKPHFPFVVETLQGIQANVRPEGGIAHSDSNGGAAYTACVERLSKKLTPGSQDPYNINLELRTIIRSYVRHKTLAEATDENRIREEIDNLIKLVFDNGDENPMMLSVRTSVRTKLPLLEDATLERLDDLDFELDPDLETTIDTAVLQPLHFTDCDTWSHRELEIHPDPNVRNGSESQKSHVISRFSVVYCVPDAFQAINRITTTMVASMYHRRDLGLGETPVYGALIEGSRRGGSVSYYYACWNADNRVEVYRTGDKYFYEIEDWVCFYVSMMRLKSHLALTEPIDLNAIFGYEYSAPLYSVPPELTAVEDTFNMCCLCSDCRKRDRDEDPQASSPEQLKKSKKRKL